MIVRKMSARIHNNDPLKKSPCKDRAVRLEAQEFGKMAVRGRSRRPKTGEENPELQSQSGWKVKAHAYTEWGYYIGIERLGRVPFLCCVMSFKRS